jgi:hypothetical protein
MIDQAEETDEEIFFKFHGRLRQVNAPREGLLLFNPDGHNWLWKRFIDPGRSYAWKQRYKVVEATPFDNPNLPDDYLEQFDSLPKHWYDRYVLGSHDVFVGQIFVGYNPEVHVIPPFYIPEEWERYCSIDPGIGHEGAISWAARDYDDNVFYYREIVKQGKDIEWWSSQMFDAEQRSDWGGPNERMEVRLIGPEAQQRSQTDGRTVKGVYEEEGVDDLELADRDPVARINRISARLRPSPSHEHPLGLFDHTSYDWGEDDTGRALSGMPSLYVFEDCAYTCEHLPQYRWRPVRGIANEEDRPERPVKKNDHTVDNLGHILVTIGDSEPEVPVTGKPRLANDDRALDEHFEKLVRQANATRPMSRMPHRDNEQYVREDDEEAA